MSMRCDSKEDIMETYGPSSFYFGRFPIVDEGSTYIYERELDLYGTDSFLFSDCLDITITSCITKSIGQ